MTINHSKTGRSTSLTLSALLLAASVTLQLNSSQDTLKDTSSSKVMAYFSCPDRKWLGRAARLAAVGTLLKVVFQKSKAGNDPSLICSPHAGIWQKLYHFYNRYVVGQKGGRARFVCDANEPDGKLEPETPTYGLVGTFWANHKDISAFLSIYFVLETMIGGLDNHIEKVIGKAGLINRLLSLTSPDNA